MPKRPVNNDRAETRLITIREALAVLEEKLAQAKTKGEKEKICKKMEELQELLESEDE